MHPFFSQLWPGWGWVGRTRGWQEHPHMGWGRGTVCREGSFVNEEDIPKILLAKAKKIIWWEFIDFFLLNELGYVGITKYIKKYFR